MRRVVFKTRLMAARESDDPPRRALALRVECETDADSKKGVLTSLIGTTDGIKNPAGLKQLSPCDGQHWQYRLRLRIKDLVQRPWADRE